MIRWLCVPVFAVVAAACSRHAEGGDAAPPAVVDAETAVATTQPFPQLVQAIGVIAPHPGRFAELAAPAPTRISRIFVAVGQRVRAGDALVEFERAPFDAAARSAAAALTSAQRAYDRAVRLVEAGILAQKDSEQAAADLAQAQVAAVTAQRAQQLATLRAPLDGVVTRMSAILGASVDPTAPLVEVADPSALDVVFNVSPAAAASLKTGDTVTVTASAGAAGAGAEALGAGVVTAVGAAVDSATRAVPVRARIAHPTRTLRIGESVFGRMVTAVHPLAVVVPVDALVPEGEGYRVFVVDSAGTAHARPVTIGGRTEAVVEVASGLAAGETVVTHGAYGTSDGAKIRKGAPR
ncbi:MAG TPA: efflux RND transporter periplasmic adaptor subunit [Gemmatimonadales bacterium]|jgi:RND family efflux transporter MFP subunit|nr:efflux RND transporter periplasmic adaptor subunit [Gemmatimonadales bacterium]